jgi:hypothetical protein
MTAPCPHCGCVKCACTLALTAPYTGRRGVLDRENSALAMRWMRDHWGRPATYAQASAAIERADAALTLERVQRSHAAAQARKSRKKAS